MFTLQIYEKEINVRFYLHLMCIHEKTVTLYKSITVLLF